MFHENAKGLTVGWRPERRRVPVVSAVVEMKKPVVTETKAVKRS